MKITEMGGGIKVGRGSNPVESPRAEVESGQKGGTESEGELPEFLKVGDEAIPVVLGGPRESSRGKDEPNKKGKQVGVAKLWGESEELLKEKKERRRYLGCGRAKEIERNEGISGGGRRG